MSALLSRRTIAMLLLLMTIALTGFPAGRAPARAQADAETSPEQQLVDRYAPTLILKDQNNACDPNGEPYEPLPVEAVLNDPQVILRQDTSDGDAAFDEILAYGPSAQDIARLGKDAYLDFPGDPLEPGCWYEVWSRSKLNEFQPTIYARIATRDDEERLQAELEATPAADDDEEPSTSDSLLNLGAPDIEDGLVIQYWFFYIYNDFNNRHEGDWEMIQLNFAADSVEGALNSSPRLVTAAQHGGAERVLWEDDKLEKDGTSPIVYVASGSHATYYSSQLFLGWGSNGTGFGCDDARGPGSPLRPKVVLIPADYQHDPAFAWLTFQGRWGQLVGWEYSGPRSIQMGVKWNEPVTWVAGTRERSLSLPSNFAGLGPMPGGFFCGMADVGAQILMQIVLNTQRTVGLLSAGAVSVAAVLFAVRRPLWRGREVYWVYHRALMALGIVFVPIGFVVTTLQQIMSSVPPFSWMMQLFGWSDNGRLAAAIGASGLLGLAETLLIAPAVIAMMELVRRNQPLEPAIAWRSVKEHFRELGLTYLTVNLSLALRTFTIILLPWVLRDAVRWAMVNQAVVVEDADSPRSAKRISTEVVRGRWLRTAVLDLVISALMALPSPLIGIVLLVVFSPSIEFVNILASMVFAVLIPFKTVVWTLIYYDRTGRMEEFLAALRTDDAEAAERISRSRRSDRLSPGVEATPL